MDFNHRHLSPALGAQCAFPFCKLLILKDWSGANGFEPSTSWSRTRHLNPINALFGVAYGTRSVISSLSVVPNLYLEQNSARSVLGKWGGQDAGAWSSNPLRRVSRPRDRRPEARNAAPTNLDRAEPYV